MCPLNQVRSVFLVSLIPCAFSHALCSACALVRAAVFGRLAGLPLGVVMLITRDIRLAPTGCRKTLAIFRADVALDEATLMQRAAVIQ